LGQWLHARLIEPIADRLARITAGHWICVGAVLLAIGLLYWLAKADGLLLASMSAPDVAVWFSTFEISTYADALITVAMASSAFRIRALRLPRMVSRLRKRQKRVAKPAAARRTMTRTKDRWRAKAPRCGTPPYRRKTSGSARG
jgi:hypothetical protein